MRVLSVRRHVCYTYTHIHTHTHTHTRLLRRVGKMKKGNFSKISVGQVGTGESAGEVCENRSAVGDGNGASNENLCGIGWEKLQVGSALSCLAWWLQVGK